MWGGETMNAELEKQLAALLAQISEMLKWLQKVFDEERKKP
jgi:hypothetical protein